MASNDQTAACVSHLKKVLTCPVCSKLMSGAPIYVCESGHGLCKQCRETFKKDGKSCSVCQKPLTDMRNVMVEQIIEGMPGFPEKKCKFEECNFAAADSEAVEKHEGDCRHRKVECFICNEDQTLSLMVNHNLTKHQYKRNQRVFCHLMAEPPLEIRGEGEPYFYSTKKRHLRQNPKVTLMHPSTSGPYFFMNIFFFEGNYHIWISHDQSKFAKRLYKYTFALFCGYAKDDGKTLPIVEYSAFCSPLDVTFARIKENMSCLVISATVMLASVDSTNKLNFGYSVQKM